LASSASVFIAGVGTTFIILGVGFGGGLMMAKSALKEPTGYQVRASAEAASPVRVILPSPAEASEPAQRAQVTAAAQPQMRPLAEQARASVENQVERFDTGEAQAEQRERRKRI
jgi:hypothetical protein